MNRQTKIILLLCVSIVAGLFGCKNWEYNVVKNGVHFDKIHQSKSGTHVGYMTEDRNILGFPCAKGWIHFKKDWRLQSFQLSRDFSFRSTLLPAHTWIHFPYQENRSGYVCSFPHDYVVQGYRCGGSGGYKGTHTGFYENGRLRSFFPPDDVIVDGIPCEASLLANVNLYENGNIKSCKLSVDLHKDGKYYKRGQTIEFAKKEGDNVKPGQ